MRILFLVNISKFGVKYISIIGKTLIIKILFTRKPIHFVLSFCRFHTAFLQERPANSFHLKMERHEIDNPHKPKTWSDYPNRGIYPKHFSIEVFLEKPSENKRY